MRMPPQVQELIDRFDTQSELYKAPTYNETNLRIDFVNPMFKALGWDIDNTKGYAEAFREVVHEDAIRIAGTVKSPDYSFRIGGRRIFFLEAKKAAVNIHTDVEAAFQLRRYAWTAGLPLSILTNFKELAVYDCRVKPKFLEKPPRRACGTSRTKTIRRNGMRSLPSFRPMPSSMGVRPLHLVSQEVRYSRVR